VIAETLCFHALAVGKKWAQVPNYDAHLNISRIGSVDAARRQFRCEYGAGHLARERSSATFPSGPSPPTTHPIRPLCPRFRRRAGPQNMPLNWTYFFSWVWSRSVRGCRFGKDRQWLTSPPSRVHNSLHVRARSAERKSQRRPSNRLSSFESARAEVILEHRHLPPPSSSLLADWNVAPDARPIE
jgi:hypothetical protein